MRDQETWAGDVRDVLSALVGRLSVDPVVPGDKALLVWRGRSPTLVKLSEEEGDDPAATSAAFMEILLGSLRSDIGLQWKDCERRAREFGRRRAARGMPVESAIDELAVYRRAAIELISARLQDTARRDEIIAYAQSHLDDVTERLMRASARGYLDRINAESRLREGGLASAMSAVGRSLEVARAGGTAFWKSIAGPHRKETRAMGRPERHVEVGPLTFVRRELRRVAGAAGARARIVGARVVARRRHSREGERIRRHHLDQVRAGLASAESL